jgi:hypothetical protein
MFYLTLRRRHNPAKVIWRQVGVVMHSYTVKNDWRIWQAETPEELADKLRQALDPQVTRSEFMRTWPDRTALPAGQTVRPAAGTNPHADDAKNWFADLSRIGWIKKPPNFDDIVKVILATFTVFTGLTLTRFLTTNPGMVDIGDLGNWHWWGFFSLVALLLRYIIGSAIHLNSTYGGAPPRSTHVSLLFKDLMFLVFFGMLALYIMEATEPGDFVRRAMLFVLAGFAWSILDYLIRRFVCYASGNDEVDDATLRIIDMIAVFVFVVLAILMISRSAWKDIDSLLEWSAAIVAVGVVFTFVNAIYTSQRIPTGEWPLPFWRVWAYLDAAQFLLTGILILHIPSGRHDGLALIVPLAILYVGFLLADMIAMTRTLRPVSE